MNQIVNSSEFKEIVKNLSEKKFNEALVKTKLLSKRYSEEEIILKLFASIYFNLQNWEKAIKYYKKNLLYEKEKFKIYTNIGVALFNLGKINKSIDAFKNSIKENPKFDLVYNNLGISYLELGHYEKAMENFIEAIKLNKNNYDSQKNLIGILNLSKPKNRDQHYLVKLDYQINQMKDELKIVDIFDEKNIKKILEKSNNLIENIDENLFLNETQIFRKNSKNLNCNRHFKVFNKFKIIPKFCFNCYKIQINLKTVVDLVKLSFVFDDLILKNNNTRKCMIEIRNQIEGNYKGYIYCTGLPDAENIHKKIKKILSSKKINDFDISIKHGCSEFYEIYPKFKEINFNGKQEMDYKKSWEEKEKLIDKNIPSRIKADKKIWTESLKGLNLSDILIINNWLKYADIIGDYSYKKIYNKKVNNNSIKNLLNNQLDFRKENLN